MSGCDCGRARFRSTSDMPGTARECRGVCSPVPAESSIMSCTQTRADAFRRRVSEEARVSEHPVEAAVRRPVQGRTAREEKRHGSGICRLPAVRRRATTFRHLDWKAYLRLNRLILRLFEEEEDLPIYFFVDCSQSMSLRPAFEIRLCANASRQRSAISAWRISTASTSSRMRTRSAGELPPQRGKGRIFKVFRFLDRHVTGGETNAKDSFKTYCTEHPQARIWRS